MKRTFLIIGLLLPLTACTTWSSDSNDTANGGSASLKVSSTPKTSVSTSSFDTSDYSPLTDEEKKEVATLIANRINTYVTKPSDLGGKYFVTDIQWDSSNTAIVMYEDDRIQGKAHIAATIQNGEVEILQFEEFFSE